MNPHTDLLPLQLWLAKQLPEEISYLRDRFIWIDKGWVANVFVTPREWDYIVQRVEDKVDIDAYAKALFLEVTKIECGKSENVCMNWWTLKRVTTAPWPTRTIALMKLKGEME